MQAWCGDWRQLRFVRYRLFCLGRISIELKRVISEDSTNIKPDWNLRDQHTFLRYQRRRKLNRTTCYHSVPEILQQHQRSYRIQFTRNHGQMPSFGWTVVTGSRADSPVLISLLTTLSLVIKNWRGGRFKWQRSGGGLFVAYFSQEYYVSLNHTWRHVNGRLN